MATGKRGAQINRTAAAFTAHAAVTPSDSTELAEGVVGLYVLTSGNLALVPINNTDAEVQIYPVVAGQFLPGVFRKVMATNTTATCLAWLQTG